MSDYLYDPEDGKIHTRYSELLQCTPNQMDKVIARRVNPQLRFQDANTRFGTTRHEMWAAETAETLEIPNCFGQEYNLPIDYVENEFASEILPGIVIHSRIDAASSEFRTIIDYKTLIADSREDGCRKAYVKYKQSRQLTFYAFQLGLHGIRITSGWYLIEIWNKDHDTILGYTRIAKSLSLADIAAVLPFIKQRVAVLASALEDL